MPKISFLIAAHDIEPFIRKGLDSIPWHCDIEVIARNNASTDNTEKTLLKYKEEHPDYNFKIVSGEYGTAASNYNALLELATGEYVQFMDGDDYFYTKKYEKIIAMMNGEDCIYMDLVINNGDVWKLLPDTREHWCASYTKAMRREFIKGLKFPEHRIVDGDWFFNQELLKKNPVSVFTGIPAYHYNFPRKGSLINLRARGLIKEID